jgi:hypothetical protein
MAKRKPAKKQRLRCPNCDGGLTIEDYAYGLICPRCQIRIAGPFESGHDIPDYVPAPLSGTAVATIRFKSAQARRDYLAALRTRLSDAGYGDDQIDDMLGDHAFPPKERIGYVYGRDDADRAVDVAAEVHGVTAELGRTGDLDA